MTSPSSWTNGGELEGILKVRKSGPVVQFLTSWDKKYAAAGTGALIAETVMSQTVSITPTPHSLVHFCLYNGHSVVYSITGGILKFWTPH